MTMDSYEAKSSCCPSSVSRLPRVAESRVEHWTFVEAMRGRERGHWDSWNEMMTSMLKMEHGCHVVTHMACSLINSILGNSSSCMVH